MCHLFVKVTVIYLSYLIKAISFSIHVTFRISAMRLFIFMTCFSLDLINNLFLKIKPLLAES